jgi:hypothetical protein
MVSTHISELPRRRFIRRGLGLALALCGAFDASESRAALAVPLVLQVELLVKIAPYDRSLQQRANGGYHVLIVVKADDAAAEAAAGQVERRLEAVPRLAGLPLQFERLTFTTAAALADRVRERKTAIAYFMPGLTGDMTRIREALAGVSVLSMSTLPEDVALGAVVGFDLVSSKPKLLVNLTQAHRQNVNLSSDVLRIATVLR